MKFIFALAAVAFLLASLTGESDAQADGCFCTANYEPVCATNGVTYSNMCRLNCDRARFLHDGICRGWERYLQRAGVS